MRGPHMGNEDKGGGAKKEGGVRKKGERSDRKTDTGLQICVNMFTSDVQHKTVAQL